VHEADPLVGRRAPAVDELRLGDGPAHRAVDAVARRVIVDVELEPGRHRPRAEAAAVIVQELDAAVGRALDELEVAARRRADGLDAPLGDVVPAVVAVIARGDEAGMRAIELEVRPLAAAALEAHRPRDPAHAILADADEGADGHAPRRGALVAEAPGRDVEPLGAEVEDVERRPETRDVAVADRAPRLGEP